MKRLNLNTEKHGNFLFSLLLMVLYLLLDYQTILFLPPQGFHFMRQTDSLSFAANYLQNGFSFFQPAVFNLQSIDGKAACEFPILYYFAAICYKIFGQHEFILRLITLIIASTGFFYLFKLLHSLLHDFVYAAAFSFLFISSTVLLYYANNFLPDASALGFTLVAWYFFFFYIENQSQKRPLILSFVFFTLASLLKVTFFINPIAAMLSAILYVFFREKNIKNSLKRNISPLIFFTVSMLFVLSWNLYVIFYNEINHVNSFLIQAQPIWILTSDQILQVIDYMSNYWYSKYYYQSTFHGFLMLFIAGILFYKKAENLILIPAIILSVGSICYFLLFFAQFKDHDYYFTALIPGIIFLIISSFITLRNRFPRLIGSIFTKLLLVILVILSLNYAREKLADRYKVHDDKYAGIGLKLENCRQYLDLLGISENAKFVIITDQTPNGGLYFINRKGWALKDTSEESLAEFENHIKQGADYVLFTDKKQIISNFVGEKISEKDGIVIYKIK